MSEMTTMQKIGKLWTDAIAYVALLVSAGLSLAGNVVDTYRIRGAATDALDVWLAVTWPGLVVLMVHVFVSTRWYGLRWYMQILRWAGCLSIMGVAMRASWIHLNDLLVSRSQAPDVAILGPLAIDFLAIMSTALILAGRTRPDIQPITLDQVVATSDKIKVSWEDMAKDTTVAVQPDGSWTQMTSESIWERLDGEIGQTEPTPPAPVSPAPAPRVTQDKIPAAARAYFTAWSYADMQAKPTGAEVDKLLASEFGKSERTIRGWRNVFRITGADLDTLPESVAPAPFRVL